MYVFRSNEDGIYNCVSLVPEDYSPADNEITHPSPHAFEIPFILKNGKPEKCENVPGGIPVSIERSKMEKIESLRRLCRETINNGSDVQLSDGASEHFNFSDIDQSNIKQLWDAVKNGATAYPYQSDSGSCKIYKAADIAKIYIAMSMTITSNLTYYHQLKDYVNSLESASDIESVTWGQELMGTYLEHYNAMMAEANLQMNEIVRKAGDMT